MTGIVGLMIAAAAPSTASIPPIDPIVAFRDVCLKGEARFSKAQMSVVDRLPTRARRELRPAPDARLFVSTDQDNMMAIAVGVPQNNAPQVCQLYVDRLDEKRLSELDFQTMADDKCPPRSSCKTTSWRVDSIDGYSLRASRVGSKAIVLEAIMHSAGSQAQRIVDTNMVMDAAASPAARRAAALRLLKEGK